MDNGSESDILGTVLIWLVILAVAGTILVYALRWLYRRSTKATSFVRTGLLGEKVVINGGALVIPVVHEVTPVNMGVMRIEVRRGDGDALITKDRMRVDIIAEFYVRVSPTREAVAAAAQTLGHRTLDLAEMRELLEGRFVSGLRGIAAEMTLENLHEQRNDYADRVKAAVDATVQKNGLQLEAVALVQVDQTSLEFFDPSNTFDAEGLTAITERIESRRKLRNDIEQGTMLQIRARNLESERSVLEIERESEYARLEQEREVEVRRAVQRAELVRERAVREQEGEQAQITAREAIEKTRIAHERALADIRISSEEETQRQEIARRRAVDEAEIGAQRDSERERIAADMALDHDRVARAQEQERLEIEKRRALEIAEREREMALAAKAAEVAAAVAKRKEAEVSAQMDVDLAGIKRDAAVDRQRVEREQTLESLEIARRQAFQEAEIGAEEDVERARLAMRRALEEARIVLERDVRTLEIAREQALALAEADRAIAVAEKSKDRSAAAVEAEQARALAIEAEERAFTAREREIAERRKAIDLIAAAREAEIDRLRLTAQAKARQEAAGDLAAAAKIAATGDADAEKIRAEAAKARYAADAEGATALNEADNLLTEAARAARLRDKLLDKIEGIVRESVRPMEKIEAIKILHVDGLGGGGTGGGKNVTDEVIDSALRYRVQAPMIDNLMREVGIEGGSVGRLTDVVRDARDLASLARGKTAEHADTDAPGNREGTESAEREPDRDR